ncbi:MAG: hypothetical protein ACD_75C02302G0001 [uncultured bacterium]|nr:MAG: hypothetical protein ACD_75C02302G0001 [uncultured bacterium]
MRVSAAILSPSERMTTSPGTSASEGIRLASPARRTSTRCGRNFFKAVMAFSARYSWKKLNRALSRATPVSAQPRRPMPSSGLMPWAMKQMVAARISRMVKRLVNCRPRRRSSLHRSTTS